MLKSYCFVENNKLCDQVDFYPRVIAT